VAFDEHGGDDVVTGAEVGEQLVQQVAVVRAIPQMVMRVDDRKVRLEDGLGGRFPEPVLARWRDATELRRDYLPSSAATGA
jgi:hypothetical protein